MVVDFRGKRLMEVVEGRTIAELEQALAYIPERDNVRLVALDMSDVYMGFAKRFFPNARLVADKFHVLRLLNPALTRRRKDITGDRRSAAIRRLLLRNGFALTFWSVWSCIAGSTFIPSCARSTSPKKLCIASIAPEASTAPTTPSEISSLSSLPPHCPSSKPSAEPSCVGRARSWPTSIPASPMAVPRASTSRQSSSNAELSVIDPSETIDCGS